MDFDQELKEGALALGLHLSQAQVAAFAKYSQVLAAESRKFNLTAVPVDKYIEEHFLDSLTLLQTDLIKDRAFVADIGAGAGFPGVPIKIALPDVRLSLIEANKKKAGFLDLLIDLLGLGETKTIAIRAEEAGRDPALRGHFDIAVVRAVAGLPVLLEYAMPLLKTGGWLLAMKGPGLAEEREQAEAAAEAVGAEIVSAMPVGRGGVPSKRTIVTARKVRSTPDIFPRRTGIPSKRPLGGREV